MLNKINTKAPLFNFLPLIALVLFSCGIFIYSTKWGIGTSPDSAAYIGVAENILAGKGLTMPYGNPPGQFLTFFPPLYPVFLSVVGLSGISILQSARLLHVILVSVNLWIFFSYLQKLLPSSVSWLSTILLLPMALSSSFIKLHIMAWSEPLFLVGGFGGMYFAALGLSRNQNKVVLFGSLLLGLTCLIRYSGFVFIAVLVLGILLLRNEKFWNNLLFSIYLSLPALLMTGIWISWNFIISNTFANRGFEFHLIQKTQLQQGLDTISSWLFIPTTLPGIIKIGILGFCASLFLLAIFRNLNYFERESKFIAVFLIIFSVLYPIFLVISITFFDANTPLDDRILSPLFLSFWLLLATGIGQWLRNSSIKREYQIASVILVISLFCGISIARNIKIFQNYHSNGIGFSHLQWRDSELIKQIKQLPPQTTIFTNSPEAIYLLTGRPSIPLPRKIDLTRQMENFNFQEDMNQLNSKILKENVVMAYFYKIQSKAIPTETEINHLLSVQVKRMDLSDGILIGGGN
ncbi:MAG: hypothetical protein AB1457_02775 [Chloroflexota bacterium]|nr:MAG: hypothetical protein KatS3mg047_0893 [Bellilinea sp.]